MPSGRRHLTAIEAGRSDIGGRAARRSHRRHSDSHRHEQQVSSRVECDSAALVASARTCHAGRMTKSDRQTCEVSIGSTWRAVSVDEAAAEYIMAVKRCPACHGKVMILGAYSGSKVRRTLSHRKSHAGCPLQPDSYCGTPSPHPEALI